ncbi:xanthine dehydrogenase accessory protein XdhC [Photobacterium lipolyticum]|uniref:Xanthine dehydrogenase accessory protein XdhC n=1 Tax=Photobacterium lipolyticum TaxID=266810 RepID=A0A2T3N345_9GAMM|nr:xanthine dehydrogenase accessory protein XdhC [Photobacterium lipolyticum]PSW06792.1 xanthine dehydrogenase accessory protein XdhC [Photobacterium lipolyticum]
MFGDDWIHELARLKEQGEACVLVTVLEEKGSVPRDAGTKMVVTRDSVIATIGGGHLEYQATQISREMLLAGEHQLKIERFNLSARLGQCCGGVASLSFEPLCRQANHLALFGAGHVANALIHIVSTLPFKVTWIDERGSAFPDPLPSATTKVISDNPVAEVNQIPPRSYYLVMTHSHQLDFELARAILKRNDIAYFGLIGSTTKCKQFSYRLLQRGYSQTDIERMTCPIGIRAVKGKHPAEIAVSVAAQLIIHYQEQEHQQTNNHPQSV